MNLLSWQNYNVGTYLWLRILIHWNWMRVHFCFKCNACVWVFLFVAWKMCRRNTERWVAKSLQLIIVRGHTGHLQWSVILLILCWSRCIEGIGLTIHSANKPGQTCLPSFNAKFGSQHYKDVFKNRYTNLWKQFNDVNNLLGQSGFSWDESRQMVVADDYVWNAYIQVQPLSDSLISDNCSHSL